MKRTSLLSALLILVLVFSLTGCGIFNKKTTAKIYGGADPKGDYIALTIEGSQVTYHNYTTNETYGPFSFWKVTDSTKNGGFQNMYQTEDVGGGKFVRFVIIEGVTLVYQMFNANESTTGNPVYAFCRKQVNINDYQGTAYNWVKFKMDATPADSNFEAGFAAFDTNSDVPAGRFYGAGYSNRDEIESNYTPPYGVHSINESDPLGTSSFIQDLATVSNKAGNLTLIGTETNDFILDFGANEGAGFAIRQAASKSYMSTYDGTYFIIVYENNNANDKLQTIQVMKLVLTSGNWNVYQFDGSPVTSGSLTALEDFTGGPGPGPVNQAVKEQFKTASNCTSALSTIVNQAYNCHGTFISEGGGGGDVILFTLDPSGRYLSFTNFDKISNDPVAYNYRFGFGIKDPNYIAP